jgi:hypothetical protein
MGIIVKKTADGQQDQSRTTTKEEHIIYNITESLIIPYQNYVEMSMLIIN